MILAEAEVSNRLKVTPVAEPSRMLPDHLRYPLLSPDLRLN